MLFDTSICSIFLSYNMMFEEEEHIVLPVLKIDSKWFDDCEKILTKTKTMINATIQFVVFL